jgi:uncharacterized protein (DUF302 family)
VFGVGSQSVEQPFEGGLEVTIVLGGCAGPPGRNGPEATMKEREVAAHGTEDAAGTCIKESPRSVADTVDRLLGLAAAKGLTVFTVIDHSGEARSRGLELRDTKVVFFGIPEAGTPVMVAAPLAALDLPLKVLVWDDEGQTKVSYTAPSALAVRHHLSDELAGRLAGIENVTDALVAP